MGARNVLDLFNGRENSDGSGGGKYDYTSRTTLGWKRKEEEYDDDDFDQFAPDNSASYAKLAKLVVKAPISKSEMLRAMNRADHTFGNTHMLVITADEPGSAAIPQLGTVRQRGPS